MLSSDIRLKVIHDFDRPDEAQLVLKLLEEFKAQNRDLSGDRIVRCIVFVANGDLDLLDKALQLAVIDYRDLIVWAEYDKDRVQIRDMTKPFKMDR